MQEERHAFSPEHLFSPVSVSNRLNLDLSFSNQQLYLWPSMKLFTGNVVRPT
jgi:hypothetical protein